MTGGDDSAVINTCCSVWAPSCDLQHPHSSRRSDTLYWFCCARHAGVAQTRVKSKHTYKKLKKYTYYINFLELFKLSSFGLWECFSIWPHPCDTAPSLFILVFLWSRKKNYLCFETQVFAMLTRLALNSKRSTCLSLTKVLGLKVCMTTPSFFFFFC